MQILHAYADLPFKFRMSPLEEIEADLQEAQLWNHDPLMLLSSRLQGLEGPNSFQRAFLVGANPFVLRPERLRTIAGMVHQYFPKIESIGCFARVTDIAPKSGGELRELRDCGYDRITIGVETGDNEALAFMNKGYQARDILEQTEKLDAAGISYNFFYLTGISGAGRGAEGARQSADIFNQTHPEIIGASMLTIFPESKLYRESQRGNWKEAGELEKLSELKTLIEHLTIDTRIVTDGASNLVQVRGKLPEERKRLADYLERLITAADESALREYRVSLRHL